MPRKSPEAIAGMYQRHAGKSMSPPSHLEPDVAAIWKAVAGSRPPDFFNVGNAPLLEAYCEALVMQRFYVGIWRDDPNKDHVRSITMLSTTLASLATKLRLANTSIDKRSGILSEQGDPEPTGETGNVIRADVLFGDGTARF
jgi:hypothetical protein